MAVTQNIHYGLVPWASGTFTAGQRCSNAGNAYQCTIAGNSSSAPTGIGNAINNGGVAYFKWLSAIDFISLQAWANALPATLAQPYTALLWNNGSITTTSGVPFLTLAGHTTSSVNHISIATQPSEGFISSLLANPALPLAFSATTGVNFILPATGIGGINYFTISDANVTIDGLQFKDPNPTSGSTILNTGASVIVQNCIFDGYSQTGGAAIINPGLVGAPNSVITFTNNLVVDRASGASILNTVLCNYAMVAANNTFVAVNAPGSLYAISDQTTAAGIIYNITNNAFIGYGVNCAASSTTATLNVQYCATNAASIVGGGVVLGPGNVYNVPTTGQFVNATTNFRLAATSALIFAGTVDTTDIPPAIDIIAQARPLGNWSIGAYQFLPPTSVFSGQGNASGAFANIGARSLFNGGGHASGGFVRADLYRGAFTGGGQASGAFVSTANKSGFGGGGSASGVFYDVAGAVTATITLANPGPQLVNVPFAASGTYTLTPDLQFANDASSVFTPIPLSGVSPIGSTAFEFLHPGIVAPGEYNLLVEDLSTDAAAAVNYLVATTATPIVNTLGTALTALSAIIPAYAYQEYYDDDNIVAFFTAYNNMAQTYLDWFNAINLPIYTGPLIVGPLLDWVAQGLYGITRPTIASVTTGPSIGPFNTYPLNTIPINSLTGTGTSTLLTVTDDIFKRIITWNFYKGDGFGFSIMWLKRRVARFLAGVNGTDYTGPTYQISVTFSGSNSVAITLTSGVIPLTVAPLLQAAVLSLVLPLPFQYSFSVLINTTVNTPPSPSGIPAFTLNIAANSGYIALTGGF